MSDFEFQLPVPNAIREMKDAQDMCLLQDKISEFEFALNLGEWDIQQLLRQLSCLYFLQSV
jgi:hypothetical protein